MSGFKALVKSPDLIAEVTTEPLNALGVDAAILFSDILVIPEAMGLDYDIIEAKGPVFTKRINDPADIDSLRFGPDAGAKLDYVYESIIKTKKRINHRTPLIGFAGAPWTLFAYMIEGSGSKTFSRAKRFLYEHPEASHSLLNKVTESIISYLKQKIVCGVDLIQVFDSWADQLSVDQYVEFSIPYVKRIFSEINYVSKIFFPKGAWSCLAQMKDIPFDRLSLDWKTPPVYAREILGSRVILQGNMDPCQLYASEKAITVNANRMLGDFGRRHIVNLGHGVYPDTEADKVRHFVNVIKSFRYS